MIRRTVNMSLPDAADVYPVDDSAALQIRDVLVNYGPDIAALPDAGIEVDINPSIDACASAAVGCRVFELVYDPA